MHHHSWKVKIPPLLFHTDCQPRHPQTPGPGGPRARKPQPSIEAERFPTFAPRLRILPPDGSWLPPPGPWPRGRRRPVTLPECRQLPPWPASRFPIRGRNHPRELATCPHQLPPLPWNSSLPCSPSLQPRKRMNPSAGGVTEDKNLRQVW